MLGLNVARDARREGVSRVSLRAATPHDGKRDSGWREQPVRVSQGSILGVDPARLIGTISISVSAIRRTAFFGSNIRRYLPTFDIFMHLSLSLSLCLTCPPRRVNSARDVASQPLAQNARNAGGIVARNFMKRWRISFTRKWKRARRDKCGGRKKTRGYSSRDVSASYVDLKTASSSPPPSLPIPAALFVP